MNTANFLLPSWQTADIVTLKSGLGGIRGVELRVRKAVHRQKLPLSKQKMHQKNKKILHTAIGGSKPNKSLRGAIDEPKPESSSSIMDVISRLKQHFNRRNKKDEKSVWSLCSEHTTRKMPPPRILDYLLEMEARGAFVRPNTCPLCVIVFRHAKQNNQDSETTKPSTLLHPPVRNPGFGNESPANMLGGMSVESNPSTSTMQCSIGSNLNKKDGVLSFSKILGLHHSTSSSSAYRSTTYELFSPDRFSDKPNVYSSTMSKAGYGSATSGTCFSELPGTANVSAAFDNFSSAGSSTGYYSAPFGTYSSTVSATGHSSRQLNLSSFPASRDVESAPVCSLELSTGSLKPAHPNAPILPTASQQQLSPKTSSKISSPSRGPLAHGTMIIKDPTRFVIRRCRILHGYGWRQSGESLEFAKWMSSRYVEITEPTVNQMDTARRIQSLSALFELDDLSLYRLPAPKVLNETHLEAGDALSTRKPFQETSTKYLGTATIYSPRRVVMRCTQYGCRETFAKPYELFLHENAHLEGGSPEQEADFRCDKIIEFIDNMPLSWVRSNKFFFLEQNTHVCWFCVFEARSKHTHRQHMTDVHGWGYGNICLDPGSPVEVEGTGI